MTTDDAPLTGPLLAAVTDAAKPTSFVWMDTIIEDSPAGVDELVRLVIAIRAWRQYHGTFSGFVWPPIGEYWWTGKQTPFKVKAKNPCRLYHAPGDVAPYKTVTDGREMTVYVVEGAMGLVFRQPGYADIWARAEDCAPV